MAKRNFIPLVPSGTINADASVAQLEQDVLAMDSKVGELAEDIGDTEQEINQLKSQIEDLGDTYAKIDGSYDTMTVGNAKQLVATVGVEDKAPYLFRTTGGSADVGDRKTMEIVGSTIAWNQLMQNGNFESGSGWGNARGTTSVADNVLTYTVTELGGGGLNNRITHALSIPANHKALMLCEVKAEKAFRVFMALGGPVAKEFILTYGLSVNAWNRLGTIGFSTGDTTEGRLGCPSTYGDMAVGDVIQFRNVQYIDLTQMFGSTIADYIYSLEQATAGAGVAWFRKLFPKPYYAYNAGTLMSVKTSANVTTGFNQLSEINVVETATAYANALCAKAELLPNTTYCLSFVDTSGHKFYTNENVFQNIAITADGTRQFVVLTTKSELSKDNILQYDANLGWRIAKNSNGNTIVPGFTDVCLNLSWDGERDGEYEPYVAHTYPLDSDLELRGIPKLNADNSLYYDGDTYESNGTVSRRYNSITFNGSENWGMESSGWNHAGLNSFYIPLGAARLGKQPSDNSIIVNGISDRLIACSYNSLRNSDKSLIFALTGQGGYIEILSTLETVSDWKSFLSASPVTVVYEFATPTEETADPYQTPQIVDDFGTEEFLDTRDVPIPVGHDSMYQANLRAKLEMAPDSPSGDGDYIVRQTNGQNAYVPIAFPADELPAAPTEDGSYVLKVTVASGEATYTWEAQS